MEWNTEYLHYKVVNSLEKVLPDREPQETALARSVLKNERLNFQIALKNTFPQALSGFYIKAKGGLADFVTVRKVELAPVGFTIAENLTDDYYIGNMPAMYPDILQELGDFKLSLPFGQWRSVWISIYCKDGLPVGVFDTHFEIYAEGDGKVFGASDRKIAEFVYTVEVLDADLPPLDIPVTNWIHYDCIAAKHNVKLFGKKFFKVFAEYLNAYVDGGNNMLLVPLFTPPLDTKVGHERRTAQLVGVRRVDGAYRFDFTKLIYFIRFALKRGIKYLEFSHLFTQWGGEFCPKIIAQTEEGEKGIFGWDTPSHGEEYKRFLREFLPALCNVLDGLGAREKCFFHLTDEPRLQHLDSYKQCYQSVKPYIGDIPIIDALSDYDFFKEGLIDYPVPKTCAYDRNFVPNGVENTFVYYCWYPSDGYYSNRFLNMPSQRARILGIQLYANRAKGFLHWGFNFYNSKLSVIEIDPYAVTDGAGFFPSGDAFIVYPKEDGVVYSLRLETMREAFQDYAALKRLEERLGKEKTLAVVKEWGVKGYNEYPRSATAHIEFREKINRLIAEN